jgi:endonuclease-3
MVGETRLRAIRAVARALSRAYGDPGRQARSSPLDGLIGTLLSQNTTSTNASAAFHELKRRCPTWEDCLRAGVAVVRRAIRSAGLAEIRAPRILAILRRLRDERGALSLDFLCDAPVAEARAYLESFPGVGPKTASCVLLFECRRAVFPVDTHVARITRRLGWVPEPMSAEVIQVALEPIIPAELRHALHVALIAHGRKLCRPRAPQCEVCPILRYCPTGQAGAGRLTTRRGGRASCG